MTAPRHNIATSAPRRPLRLPAFNSRGRPARACRARGRAVNAPCLPQCFATQESGPTTPAGAVGRDLAALWRRDELSPARQPLVARSVRAGASCAAAPMTKNSAAADQVARCSATNRFMIMTSSSAVAARRPCIRMSSAKRNRPSTEDHWRRRSPQRAANLIRIALKTGRGGAWFPAVAARDSMEWKRQRRCFIFAALEVTMTSQMWGIVAAKRWRNRPQVNLSTRMCP